MKISELNAENEKLKNMLEEKGEKIDNLKEKIDLIEVENKYLKEQFKKKKEDNIVSLILIIICLTSNSVCMNCFPSSYISR